MYCNALNDIHSTDLDYWTLKDVGQDDDLLLNAKHSGETYQKIIADLLARLFVNVKHLIIYFRDERLWKAVPYLLKQFGNIISLSLCGRYYDFDFEVVDCGPETDEEEDDEKTSSQILEQVNSTSLLKRFDLLVDNFFSLIERLHYDFDYTQYRSPRDKKVLPQLERFSLNGSYSILEYPGFDDRPFSLPWRGDEIEKLNSKCTHLRLKNVPFGGYDRGPDEYYLHVYFEGLENIEFLQLEGFVDDEGTLISSISSIRSLRCLWIDFASKYDFANNDTFEYFADMPNLTELRFQPFRGVKYFEKYLKMQEWSSLIKSVTHLSWYNFTYATNGIEAQFNVKRFCKTLSARFPNLQELFIYFDILKASIVAKLQANVHIFPHFIEYSFGESPLKII